MNNSNINLSELGDAIAKALKDYDKELEKKLPQALSKSAKAGAEIVAGLTPGGKHYKASDWKSRKTGYMEYTIAHKPPGLVHLLEFGHNVGNQYGSGYGHTGAKPHVIPSLPEIQKILKDNVEKIL